ncbi:MAG TPA: gluconolaconase [Terriglobales bacterium]|nr:gluconolaconase [Terriglobales bacterium]
MGLSNRLLGKKNVNGHPHIDTVEPTAGLPGGEVRILGSGLNPPELRRPRVRFGEIDGSVVVSTNKFVIARVPDGANSGPLTVTTTGEPSNPQDFRVGHTIAENLHPVTNPALDAEGNLYVTFSGSRGQKVPVAIFKIDTNYVVKPYITDMMNATAIAFDRDGQMYVSSRFDGTVYRVARNGTMAAYAEGMGIATGIAFDNDQNLYVGDRSGTIFKVGRNKEIFVIATLEPSVSAYHLAFSPSGDLYVTGPTTSSFDSIYKITPTGDVSLFYKGLGRPQGLAFDVNGNLYVAASYSGRRGIVRLTPDAQPSMAIAGQGLVGLAFAPGRSVVLASTNAVHRLTWDVQGKVLSAPEF